MKASKVKVATLKQIYKLVPGSLVDKMAAEYKIDAEMAEC